MYVMNTSVMTVALYLWITDVKVEPQFVNEQGLLFLDVAITKCKLLAMSHSQ